MRIAALVHFCVPFRNAGSETMLHALLRSLVDAGHDVKAFSTDTPEAPFQYVYDDVSVTSCNIMTVRQLVTAYEPDVIITHHANAPRAIQLARKLGAKSVFLMHNDFEANQDYLRARPDLVVFNTDWIAEKTGYDAAGCVVHPPVYAAEHATVPGDRVTLVNLNEHKGSRLFYALAERMPDVSFLGVVGGHGDQIIRTDLRNVEIVEHTADMPGDVWSRTRVLLVPSIYESYGMVGVEAMASGIPVIAHPTAGLLESLGSAGTFVDRDATADWEATIRRLLNPTYWQPASRLALNRSDGLNPERELSEWVERIEGLNDPTHLP